LFNKFGDEFKSSGEPAQKARVVPPAPDTIIDEYLSPIPSTAEERRKKQQKVDKRKKGKLMFIMYSDQNIPGDQPQIVMKKLGKGRFADKYRDRTRILMWGFDADRNKWLVKRK